MKVIQTVSGIGMESAGPSYSVPGLCRGLKGAGVDVQLHARMRKGQDFPFNYVAYPYLRSRFLPGHTPVMLKGLCRACRDADILHSHSLWNMPSVYPARAVKGTDCKLVVAPRGALSTWALHKGYIKKKIFGWLFQNRVLRQADMFHATAESEYLDIRRLGYRQPVVIIPNGIDVSEETAETGVPTKRCRVVFLSRIHPKKNLELLLRVWSHLENEFSDWTLSIVGPDKMNEYAERMKDLVVRLKCQRVTFEGELKGIDKLNFLRESSFLVLPTHSENFGMVVAESLSCGTPVICSHGAPWQGLVPNKCGWWVPIDESAFLNAMREAMSMKQDEIAEMGERGRKWMRHDFSWTAIGVKMKVAYEWLLGQGEKPEWVRVE